VSVEAFITLSLSFQIYLFIAPISYGL